MTREQIGTMRQDYQTRRAALIEEANRQIAMLDGAIAALDALLALTEDAAAPVAEAVMEDAPVAEAVMEDGA